MGAGVLALSISRPVQGWQRFGIAAITLLGLLSLAVALHIDDLDRQTIASHAP